MTLERLQAGVIEQVETITKTKTQTRAVNGLSNMFIPELMVTNVPLNRICVVTFDTILVDTVLPNINIIIRNSVPDTSNVTQRKDVLEILNLGNRNTRNRVTAISQPFESEYNSIHVFVNNINFNTDVSSSDRIDNASLTLTVYPVDYFTQGNLR